jgi:hypothetical protein
MIDATILKNGKLKLILSGGDDIDGQVLKLLNGATCRLVADNYKLGDKNLAGCLMIEVETGKSCKAVDIDYEQAEKATLEDAYQTKKVADIMKQANENRKD